MVVAQQRPTAGQGFVEQEGTGGLYNLGAYALELALASLARLDHVRLASEALHDLCRRVDETVALAVWGNRGPVFVRWEEPAAHPVATNVRVGSVVPVLSSASGLVFAAFLPAEEVSPFIAAEIKQRAPTNHAKLRTRREVDVLLARVRGERLARVAGDLLSGVDALSVPVFDHRSRVVLAITALGDERRFDASPHGRIARALRETGDAVSRRLGYREEAAGTAS